MPIRSIHALLLAGDFSSGVSLAFIRFIYLPLGAVALLQTLYLRHHDEPFVYPLEVINLQYLFASTWTRLSPKILNSPIGACRLKSSSMDFLLHRPTAPAQPRFMPGVCVIAAAISFARLAIYFSDLLQCGIPFLGGRFFCVLIARLELGRQTQALLARRFNCRSVLTDRFSERPYDPHHDVAAILALSLSVVVTWP